MPALPDDPGERPQRAIHGRGIRKDRCHVRLQNDDVTASSHARGIWVPPALAEVIFGKDVVRPHSGGALSGLLHSGDVRDESLSGR